MHELVDEENRDSNQDLRETKKSRSELLDIKITTSTEDAKSVDAQKTTDVLSPTRTTSNPKNN